MDVHREHVCYTREIFKSLIGLGYLLWKGARSYKIKQDFVDLVSKFTPMEIQKTASTDFLESTSLHHKAYR